MSRIPTDITVILKIETDIPIGSTMYGWRGAWKTLRARPGFIADADSPKSVETGIKWAERGLNTAEQITRPNNPFTGVQIIDLDERGNGGRAWKVVTDEGHLFDLREDQLMHIILEHGIESGGKVQCEFIWGINHSQMRLLVVGSPLHLEILKDIEERAAKVQIKNIKASDLIVGGVYISKSDTVYVYAGRCRHESKKKFMWVELGWYHSQLNTPKSYQSEYKKNKTEVRVTSGVTVSEKVGDCPNFQPPHKNLSSIEFHGGEYNHIPIKDLSFEP